MGEKALHLKSVEEGINSVIVNTGTQSLLYEKAANTIHAGSREELEQIRVLSESIDYKPIFESETLKRKKDEKLESLLINVTESCNLACSYCIFSGSYEGERTHNNKEMSEKTALKAIDLFVPNSKDGDVMIGFYGGEPMNNMKLITRVISHAKESFPEHNFVFSITTNFVNAEKYLEDFVENNIFANVSLDGPKKVHDKYRLTTTGKPTYDKIMKNFELLEHLSPGYVQRRIGLNGTCKDAEDFPSIVDFFISKNDDYTNLRVGMAESKGLAGKEKQSVIPFLEEYAAQYVESLANNEVPPKVLRRLFDDSVETFYRRSNKKLAGELMLTGSCYPGQRKTFVDTDGDIYMCEKFGGRVSIGSVDEGLNGEMISEAIDNFTRIRNEACTDNCWAQRVCTPCIQSAKEPVGELSTNGLKDNCNSYKVSLALGLAIYLELSRKNKEVLKEYFV